MIRGTPLLVQLFVVFYGLPDVGILLDPFPAAVLVFAINEGAYCAETMRAALEAVPVGQIEAGYCVGMNYMQIMRRIVLPQALRTAKKDIARIRRKTAFVFQNYNLFANKMALQNVTEGLIVARKMDKARAREIGLAMLDKVGLADSASLLAAVNQAIDELRAEGELSRISEKYFGKDITTAE